VAVGVFAGTDLAARPIRLVQTTAGRGGKYMVRVTPALPDGRYTAVAVQRNAAGLGGSEPRSFRVDTQAPAVKLAQPASAARVLDPSPLFSGQAGTALGDSSAIAVALYAGRSASGRRIGTLHANANGSSWSRRWPRELPAGVYTAQAFQRDDAGHTGRSAAHTFRVLPQPAVIGSTVTLDRTGVVSVAVGCHGGASDTCKGTVLVSTTGAFQPVAGGPVGRLNLLYAFVSVPGGRTMIARGTVSADAAAAVRRPKVVPVLVRVDERNLAGRRTVASARRNLRRR
jgi:hypothetical protein